MPPTATQTTIWLALICWFLATGRRIHCQGREDRTTRLLWTLGFAAYVAHVLLAFHFHHQWSHDAAVEDVAKQTGETTGFHWGGGIWFNHFFTLAWAVDTIHLWLRPDATSVAGQKIRNAWRGFMFFMIFNATVVFEDGFIRWFGLAGCLTIAILLTRELRRSRLQQRS